MIEIEKPSVITEETSENKNYGKFIIGPLERGFGSTLGNSLRRVLLSSLPGTAPKSIKIDGVMHEFSTISGVKEDVPEIVLNIKNLKSKLLFSEEDTIVRIDKTGECEITAKDIIHDSEVEILNLDMHIASLNKNSSLKMEILLSNGRGYVSLEKNRDSVKTKTLGSIPVDSIYTPVTKVNYYIEPTRVGQFTDYDKLVLEVWTNGVLTAHEAISLSAKILTEHLNLFLEIPDVSQEIQGLEVTFEKSKSSNTISNIINKNKPRKALNLSEDTPIENLDFSVRAYNCLKRANINVVKDLAVLAREELESVKNLGKKSLDEILGKLQDIGIDLQSRINLEDRD
ncbi:MAG: DNA-directed RNA polymerase subunit alpha [Candidatus Paraimprobicoccus trichonymphae]|uniref:DNA-directed RNA polymerase subunit alpha n=1 Tax=Candidatus Paraimprobicoccus trichonymphae TaxID=3033793 RepID=A0AA48HZT7_9FIRM|nr:MAG: DNA-directed RNA polymerase subunit alpha [Candidatus Paraimprobicoccus trichonymphae]